MTYILPLTQIGQHCYHQRDQDLEKAVVFLVGQIGNDAWQLRRADIASRFGKRLSPDPAIAPIEGVSIRDREDEVGWYIFLCETSIADPPAVNADQLSRVAPYLSAFGRNIPAIKQIVGVEARLSSLVRRLKNQDPDQALFELLVGAAYVREGWTVTAIPETGAAKTPDFLVAKANETYEVECKRLSRRADYTTLERDAWLRQYKPVSEWLFRNGYAWVLTVNFHVEVVSLPDHYLLATIHRGMEEIASGRVYRDDKRCSISGVRTDLHGIRRHLERNYLKVNCAAERVVIGGRYERDFGFTCAVHGQTGSMGEREVAGNKYWLDIDYAHAAFWHCDAPEAIEKKARDVRKRLAEATGQFTGAHPGMVHIGVETTEGDDVELVRSRKVIHTVQSFDPEGKPLEWISLHFFRGEAPPNEDWAFDETRQIAGRRGFQNHPLQSAFLVYI